MSKEKFLAGLFTLGLTMIAVSFLRGGLTGQQHTLTVEKAKEIQQARRKFHGLSHEFAQHAAGGEPSADDDGNLKQIERSKVEAAEAEFNRLHAEIEAIRNSRPWLTILLRIGGVGACLLAGILAFATGRQTSSEQLDAASASAISAYESQVSKRS